MSKDAAIGPTPHPGWSSNHKGVVEEAISIYSDAMSLRKPDLSQVDLKRGFEVSAAACRQQEEVPISPIMKNILKYFGDVKDEDWRLRVDDPETQGEKWLKKRTEELLIKVNGVKVDSYDESMPLDSKHFYDVDCWRNFKDNWRDIQPGQADERLAQSKVFGEPMDPGPLFSVFQNDPVMRKAIEFVFASMPAVRATTGYENTALPFMRKHTNVGFKWWYNDRSIDPETGKTYGQMAQETAESLTYKDLPQWNVYTAFGRNQRGKGRLLIASARPVNLFLNRLEAEEIQKLKRVGYFAGYNDEAYLKETLKYILHYCEANGLRCSNWDQSKYDAHINPAWLALVGSLRQARAEGALGKALARWRAMLNIHGWLVNGMTHEVEEIYGRMFSGFIDTNQGDGWVEAIANTYCLMKQDPDYTKFARRSDFPMLVMGDDSLITYDPSAFDHDTFVEDMSGIGFEVNKEKGEFGVFFLQNRLFRSESGLVMVYPWTRVLRSMMFSETTKGLGPYGWLLAQYQQLSKLREYPPALDAVVQIVYPFDKLKLGVDLSVDQILERLKQEDSEAAAEDSSTQYLPTEQKLFDGDPTKQSQFNEDGSISIDYLTRIHAAVRESVQRIGRSNMRMAVKSDKTEFMSQQNQEP